MKRKKKTRRTEAQIAQDNQRMIAMLDAGRLPKAIAHELGLGVQAVYTQARKRGYRMLMVRQEMLRNLLLAS